MPKIIIIIPYFGPFPDWKHLFFETLKRNKTIDFYFFTDNSLEEFEASNILVHNISFDNYVKLVTSKLRFPINIKNPYKICDLRPLFGFLHNDVIKNYDYYGWTDVDILFGDIREFYTNDVLKKYNVFSTHAIRLSGHFALFKNTPANVFMFKKIYQYKQALANKNFVGIDEHGLTNAYTLTLIDKINQKFSFSINNKFTKWLSKLKKVNYILRSNTPPRLRLYHGTTAV